jgi:hypothetical protein
MPCRTLCILLAVAIYSFGSELRWDTTIGYRPALSPFDQGVYDRSVLQNPTPDSVLTSDQKNVDRLPLVQATLKGSVSLSEARGYASAATFTGGGVNARIVLTSTINFTPTHSGLISLLLNSQGVGSVSYELLDADPGFFQGLALTVDHVHIGSPLTPTSNKEFEVETDTRFYFGGMGLHSRITAHLGISVPGDLSILACRHHMGTHGDCCFRLRRG